MPEKEFGFEVRPGLDGYDVGLVLPGVDDTWDTGMFIVVWHGRHEADANDRCRRILEACDLQEERARAHAALTPAQREAAIRSIRE